jgi:hypothetical protein
MRLSGCLCRSGAKQPENAAAKEKTTRFTKQTDKELKHE